MGTASNIQDKIKSLHKNLKPEQICKENVRTLLFEIAPQLGFTRRAVFMYDPERATLSPAITMGNFD